MKLSLPNFALLNLIDLARFLLSHEQGGKIHFSNGEVRTFDMTYYDCGTSCCAAGASMLRTEGKYIPYEMERYIIDRFSLRTGCFNWNNLFGAHHSSKVEDFAKRVLCYTLDIHYGYYLAGILEQIYDTHYPSNDATSLLTHLRSTYNTLQSSVSSAADSTEIG